MTSAIAGSIAGCNDNAELGSSDVDDQREVGNFRKRSVSYSEFDQRNPRQVSHRVETEASHGGNSGSVKLHDPSSRRSDLVVETDGEKESHKDDPSSKESVDIDVSVDETRTSTSLMDLFTKEENWTSERRNMALDLIKRNANVNEVDTYGNTPLHYLAHFEFDMEVFDALIRAGADIEAPDEEGLTPLQLAARHGKVDFVKALIEKGANIDAGYDEERDPLLKAASADNADKTTDDYLTIVKALIEAGASISDTHLREAKNPRILESLRAAKKEADMIEEAAKEFTKLDMTSVDKAGQGLLHLELKKEWTPQTRANALALIEVGINVKLRDNSGNTPLHILAEGTFDKGVFKALIAGEADMNSQNGVGLTPLSVAASYAKVDAVKALIEKGADLNLAGNSGMTPLMCAVSMSSNDSSGLGKRPEYLATVEALIKAGADLSVKDGTGKSALDHATGNREIVEALQRAMRTNRN